MSRTSAKVFYRSGLFFLLRPWIFTLDMAKISYIVSPKKNLGCGRGLERGGVAVFIKGLND